MHDFSEPKEWLDQKSTTLPEKEISHVVEISPNPLKEHKESERGFLVPAEFFVTLFHNLIQILGLVSASLILYRVGKELGKLYYRRLTRQPDLTERETFLQVSGMMNSEHMCQLRLKSYDLPSGTVVVTSTSTLLGPRWMGRGLPVDFLCSGCIAGVLESITGERVSCEEKRCVARADEECEFAASLVKPFEKVEIKIDTREVEEKLRSITEKSIFRERLL